jgi:polar amino acid transport system substrate-binding protein
MLLLVLTGLFLAVAGCSSGPSSTPAQATPVEQKTLVVGIDGGYQPFSYVDSAGNPAGFDVDSMKWIAQKEGLNIKFQPTAWDGIIPALQAGKIDMVYAGMTITPERAEQVNFSIPYWEVNQDVAVKNGSTITLDDVKSGKAIIGTQSGCTAATWVDKNLITTGKMTQDHLKLYDETPLAVSDLIAGRVDAVMYDDDVLSNMTAGMPVTIIGNIQTKEEFGVAVRKDNPKLLTTMNDGLTQLKADPYWQELIKKYRMQRAA